MQIFASLSKNLSKRSRPRFKPGTSSRRLKAPPPSIGFPKLVIPELLEFWRLPCSFLGSNSLSCDGLESFEQHTHSCTPSSTCAGLLNALKSGEAKAGSVHLDLPNSIYLYIYIYLPTSCQQRSMDPEIFSPDCTSNK